MSVCAVVRLCLLAFVSMVSTLAAENNAAPFPDPLYLHFIGSNPNGDNSSLHLGTFRVTTPDRFEPQIKAGDISSPRVAVTGRIEPRGEKLFAQISADVGVSTGDFKGEVELEKRNTALSYMVTAGGIHPFSFVLSGTLSQTNILSGWQFGSGARCSQVQEGHLVSVG